MREHSEEPTEESLQKRWLAGLRPHGGAPLRLAMALPILSGALLVGQIYLLAHVLDAVIAGAASPADMLVPLLGAGALIVLRAMIAVAAESAASIAAERIIGLLRQALLARMLGHSPDWSAARGPGRLGAAVVEQADALEGFFGKYLPAMISAALLPIAFAVVVFPFDWVVGLLFLVTAPLIPLFMALAGWGAEAAKNAEATAFARLSAHFADRLRGLLTLKMFGREQAELVAVARASESLRRRTMKVLRIAFLSSAVLEFFAALGVAGVSLYVGMTFLGMIDMRGEALTLKAGLFCLMMAPEIYQPLRQLAAHYHDRAGAKAALTAIAALFDGPVALAGGQEAAEQPAIPAPTVPASLSLRGLRVVAPGTGEPILDDVDLEIAAGERVAVVGSSGCGKSTLLHAIARLRGFEGRIDLSGMAIDALPEPLLRSQLAFVGQAPRIFQGSIADNIGLGRAEATSAEIRDAAARAEVLEFAERLPAGLSTMVGDGGLGLSGGQAHRVGLARLYLRDPAIILLDEPTAHLDDDTAQRVIRGLLDFAAGRTLLVATHAHSLAHGMDRVVRIAGGRLLPALHPEKSRRGTEHTA